MAPPVAALAALLVGAGGLAAQYTPAQQQPIELMDLVTFFLLPETATQDVGDWYLFSGPASPIAWNPNEVRWDERRQTFVRDGSAVVTVDGSPTHEPGSTAPARWPIRLFGPREGFSRVAIASRVASPELSLDLPVQLAAHGVVYEAKRCDAAEATGGNRLYELSWPGYRTAWMHHQWACTDGSCAAYVSISLEEPDVSTLPGMPDTDCGIASAVVAPDVGPGLLFARGTGGLTDAEQLEIFSALGLAVAPDGASLVDTACRQPASADPQFPDLNEDGVPEVLIVYGNTCMSGMAGASVVLFVKKTDGSFGTNLGFPGISAAPMETRHEGWPDLLIGGPGFCFPVWRWNGSEYVADHDEAQAPGGCSG